MAFKDILLQLTSYPEPTPVAALDQAVAFAQASGARITALACEILVNVPGAVLAPALLDVRGLIAAEQQRSAANARALVDPNRPRPGTLKTLGRLALYTLGVSPERLARL